MALRASHPVASEQSPAALGRRAEPPMQEKGTREGLKRFKPGVDRRRILFGPVGYQNPLDAGANRRFRRRVNARGHGRRSPVREKQALGVLRVALSIVEQVPIQSVGAAVGVATRAALPAFLADAAVVKQHLAATRLIP